MRQHLITIQGLPCRSVFRQISMASTTTSPQDGWSFLYFIFLFFRCIFFFRFPLHVPCTLFVLRFLRISFLVSTLFRLCFDFRSIIFKLLFLFFFSHFSTRFFCRMSPIVSCAPFFYRYVRVHTIAGLFLRGSYLHIYF